MNHADTNLIQTMARWRIYTPRIGLPLFAACVAMHVMGKETAATMLFAMTIIVVTWIPVYVLMKIVIWHWKYGNTAPNNAVVGTPPRGRLGAPHR